MATFFCVFQQYASIFSAPGITWDGLVDKLLQVILEGIQDACKFANCKVHSDLSDDAEVFTSVHRNMFSQGFIQDMLH